jgi:RNA polymerase sigma factor (sigma-70 family)
MVMTLSATMVTEQQNGSTVPGPEHGPLLDQILALMRDPASSVSQLGAVVSTDKTLSERILQRANSPVLGLPSRVSTVSQAVTLLGFDALRDTLMRMVVSGALHTVVNLFSHYEEFWQHSIACGLAARLLAQKHGRVRPDDALVAGLFHDLGMIIPSERADGPIRWTLTDGSLPLPVAQHAEVGALLVGRWGLGERIVEAVRCHHHPGTAVHDQALAATVHVADILCQRMDIGRYSADPAGSIDPAALALLGVTEEDVVLERLQEEAARLRHDLDEAPSFDRLVSSLRNALVDAVGTLPYQERLALALCYQEGLTLGEVANLMGVTEPEARQIHDTALATLATIIHDCV